MRRHTLLHVLPMLFLLGAPQATNGEAIRVFDTDTGLPHNRVNRLFTDTKGFLWICTDDGLSRFDGHQFSTYTTADGLPHKHVNAMLETRNGDYWIATDGGLSRFDSRPDHQRFTTYAPQAGPAEASHINAILEEPDGTLLAGTSAGLYRFNAKEHPKAFERVELGPSIDPLMVNAVAKDSSSGLWLATNDGLFRRRKNATWEHYGTEGGLAADRWFGTKSVAFVNSFAQDHDGRLWAAFKGGFGRITVTPEPGAPVLDLLEIKPRGAGREIRSLWFGTDGRRWIAAESGLWEWFTDAHGASQFRQHTIRDRFPQEAFISIGEDIAGNLWTGTRRSGLVQVGSSKFRTLGADDGLQLGLEQSLLRTRSGSVSLIDFSKKLQLYRWESGRQLISIRPALPEPAASTPNWLQMAMEDQKGAWWFSTGAGLYRFSNLSGPFDLQLLPGGGVGRFFEDAAGDIWMAHWPRGQQKVMLARWERRSGQIHNESERLPPEARSGISAFAQDRHGTIWIALQRPAGGLLRWREGRFQPVSAEWRGHTNSIYLDSKDRLWVTSTENGLGVIDDPRATDPPIRRYTRTQGLSTDEVWCITEDQMGRIYVGTAKGVDRLDPATGKIVHYSTADGLVQGDIRSAVRDDKGDLWFASAHGVSTITPNRTRTIPPPRTRITALRTAGVPFPLSEFGETTLGPLRLPAHRNSMQIDFASTDYRTQSTLRYQFRLARQDLVDESQPWQDSGTSSTVHLLDLAPGDFRFQVKAITPDGFSGDPALLKFSVLQPFWLTWWFELASVLAAVGLFWWLRTRRLQQQLAVERVRSQIAMDLHDDIGAGLSRISVIAEVSRNRLRAGGDDVERSLVDIAASSRQLVADIGDIVWSLDPRRDQVGELANRLRAFGSDLLESRGLEWTVNEPPGALDQSLSPVVRRQLYLVFREAIHNVAKHSGATRATLSLWPQDGSIWGELTDDGRGIAGGNGQGAGIPGMRERVRQLHGTLEFTTPDGGGTSVRVRVPLRHYA